MHASNRKMKLLLLILITWITIVSGIILKNGGNRYYGGGGGSSDSGSSDESRPHRPPPRPRPPRPPRTPQCQAGWTTFDRPQGRWCVQVFLSQGNYAMGQAFCSSHGAVLTGFQNSTERQIIADLSLTQFQSSGSTQTVASTWIGAMRAGGSSFVWTDGHTTGVEGFKWGSTQPDGQVRSGVLQNCVQQFILKPEYWARPAWGQMFQQGDLDDWYCDYYVNEMPYVRMYACGKRP